MSTFVKNTSPSLAKRIEKEITNEAVKEDKAVKHALKELAHIEKKDNKASKNTDHAQKALEKAERKEESTLHALQKQNKKHDDAASLARRRTLEADNAYAQEEKVHRLLERKKAEVEAAIRNKDEHERERVKRLEEAAGLNFISASTTLDQPPNAQAEKGPDPRQLH
ncbi:hypothetical protein EST38_g9859 [Candolleomyces aberdarensis]|uniref:Uncharacterized protein n=1 Tax=Candolleomyces aberdarensis TaxID=2316362 RepID=A0A4Q2DB20_9AGAR|nr:hypothetical protein EST38_g9859 [Candolleomyces aberdarensis]